MPREERGSQLNCPKSLNGNSFPREIRLLKRAEFQSVFNQHQSVQARGIRLLARSGEPGPKLGFVIAKKQIRMAVQRNRIKRLGRESFRLNQQKLGSLHIIIMARGRVAQLSNQEIHTIFDTLWNKLIEKCKDLPSDSSISTG
ncbi:MAG TPA: ribonuclease P protein component [Gammaproteobacteria bacterium]|nr:ribonuclease P protein component [Gammaproteobacteria bacterium]